MSLNKVKPYTIPISSIATLIMQAVNDAIVITVIINFSKKLFQLPISWSMKLVVYTDFLMYETDYLLPMSFHNVFCFKGQRTFEAQTQIKMICHPENKINNTKPGFGKIGINLAEEFKLMACYVDILSVWYLYCSSLSC